MAPVQVRSTFTGLHLDRLIGNARPHDGYTMDSLKLVRRCAAPRPASRGPHGRGRRCSRHGDTGHHRQDRQENPGRHGDQRTRRRPRGQLEMGFRSAVRTDPVGQESREDPAQASPADLLWCSFPGDVLIATTRCRNRTDFGTRSGTAFREQRDRGHGLRLCYEASRSAYNLTETDHRIVFRKSGQDLLTECSFAGDVVTAPFPEFPGVICPFARREIRTIGEKCRRCSSTC
jgi:hypothetical protein